MNKKESPMSTGADMIKRMIEHYERRYEKKRGTICFDMDGTIADLYSIPNWLEKLQSEDPTPYIDARPLIDMEKLGKILNVLSDQGWEIRIISWLAKDSSLAYKAAVRKAKREWLEKYNFPAHKIHLIQYGTTKASCLRGKADFAILIDDNQKVRDGWHLGDTIDPMNEDIIERLRELVEG